RIAVDPKLRPLPLDDAKEAIVVVVPRLNETIEPVGAMRRRFANDFDSDRSLRRLEIDTEPTRRRRIDVALTRDTATEEPGHHDQSDDADERQNRKDRNRRLPPQQPRRLLHVLSRLIAAAVQAA